MVDLMAGFVFHYFTNKNVAVNRVDKNEELGPVRRRRNFSIVFNKER